MPGDRKMVMNRDVRVIKRTTMNLWAVLLGCIAFVLTTLAIRGLGYIYCDDLERWAKRKLENE